MRRRHAVLVVVALAVLACSVSFATPATLHVGVGGSGSSCTSGRPCSITTALAKATAGDMICMHAGTYRVNNLAFRNAGTARNVITIGDCSDCVVTFQNPGATSIFNP